MMKAKLVIVTFNFLT